MPACRKGYSWPEIISCGSKSQHKISSNWWLKPCRPSFLWALAETWALLKINANRSKAERLILLRQLICGTSWSSSFLWNPCSLGNLRLQWKWSSHQILPEKFLVLLNRQDGNSQEISLQHVTDLSWELHGNMILWICLKGNWSIDSIFWFVLDIGLSLHALWSIFGLPSHSQLNLVESKQYYHVYHMIIHKEYIKEDLQFTKSLSFRIWNCFFVHGKSQSKKSNL